MHYRVTILSIVFFVCLNIAWLVFQISNPMTMLTLQHC